MLWEGSVQKLHLMAFKFSNLITINTSKGVKMKCKQKISSPGIVSELQPTKKVSELFRKRFLVLVKIFINLTVINVS